MLVTMWSMGGIGEEPTDAERERMEQLLRRRTRPDNEMPVTVALDLTLARNDDVALGIGAAMVYRNGVAFQLLAVSRTSTYLDFFGHHPRRRDGSHGLLLGVEYSDGRRATTAGRTWLDAVDRDDDDGPALTMGGGGSSDRRAEAEFFLSPVPPPGPLTFVVLWPAAGLPETTVATTADPLAAAVAGVVELWPWQPVDRSCPPPPDLPASGWFAGP